MVNITFNMEAPRIFTLKDQLEAVCEMAKNVIGDLVYPGPCFLTGGAPLTEGSVHELESNSSIVIEDCFDFAKMMIKGLQRLHNLFDKQRKSRSVSEIINDVRDTIEISEPSFIPRSKAPTTMRQPPPVEVFVLDPPQEPMSNMCTFSSNGSASIPTDPLLNTCSQERDRQYQIEGPFIRSVHSVYSTSSSSRCFATKDTKKKFKPVKVKKPMIIKRSSLPIHMPKDQSILIRPVQERQDFDLATELSKLSGSMAIDDAKILCGICREVKQIDGNRRSYGKVNYFYRKHYAACQRRHSNTQLQRAGDPGLRTTEDICQDLKTLNNPGPTMTENTSSVVQYSSQTANSPQDLPATEQSSSNHQVPVSLVTELSNSLS